MNTTKNLKQYFEEIVNKNNDAIQKTQEEIELWDKKIINAQNKLIQAEEIVNFKKYNEAKEELFLATNSKELLKKKFKELTEEPLVSYEEYMKLVKELEDSEDKKQAEINKKTLKLVKEIELLAQESAQSINTTNTLFNVLQHKISKNDDSYKKNRDGAWIYYSNLEYSTGNKILTRDFYNHSIRENQFIKQFKN